MRTRSSILTAALLMGSAAVIAAQEPAAPAAASGQAAAAPAVVPASPLLGFVDVGYRGESLTGDEARYNRFRDLRPGPFLSRFRVQKETDGWFLRGQANNVGYRDQEFSAAFENIGRLKASFDWTQIPLFISNETRSLYTDTGNGVLVVDDAIQRAIQAGTLSATNAGLLAQPYEIRSQRNVGRANLTYTVNRDIDFKLDVKNTVRNGHNLMSFGLGNSPGLSPAVEIGAPVEDRTTDLGGHFEYANARASASIGYRGSWYDNSIPTVRFDNPLRIDSISAGTAVGQAVLWPSNTSFAVDLSGSYKLPGRSRASATFSVGRWNQDETLAPATVNPALVAPPLERSSAQARADIASVLLNVSSRPAKDLLLTGRYRYYDYSNKTARFESLALVGDWALGTAILENEPTSFSRGTLDLDASFTPLRYLTVGAGFAREDADRTFRIFEKTSEDTVRLILDSTGNDYVTLRTKYEYSKRIGSGFDGALLAEVGEQSGTRHFDIANRKRSRVTTMLAVTPAAWLSLNGALGTGHDDFYETGFGLRDNKNRTWSAGFDVVAATTVTLGMNYGYEKYTALQYSRTASPPPSPQFDDPTRDWWTDSNDTVRTVSASLDMLRTFPKTDIRLSYDLSDGKATYLYTLPANQTVTTTALAQLAPVKNELGAGRADLQYFVRANVAIGLAYWYEAYRVEDISLNSTTINRLAPVNASTGAFANTIYSGYLYRPYTVHTVWMKVSYLW